MSQNVVHRMGFSASFKPTEPHHHSRSVGKDRSSTISIFKARHLSPHLPDKGIMDAAEGIFLLRAEVHLSSLTSRIVCVGFQ